MKHPDVRLVSLTGDVETGKTIARTAADDLKRVHLELGGKAPVVVFDDADPEAVAEGIKIAGYWNAGQDCTAASRVMAGPNIYESCSSGSCRRSSPSRSAIPPRARTSRWGP